MKITNRNHYNGISNNTIVLLIWWPLLVSKNIYWTTTYLIKQKLNFSIFLNLCQKQPIYHFLKLQNNQYTIVNVTNNSSAGGIVLLDIKTVKFFTCRISISPVQSHIPRYVSFFIFLCMLSNTYICPKVESPKLLQREKMEPLMRSWLYHYLPSFRMVDVWCRLIRNILWTVTPQIIEKGRHMKLKNCIIRLSSIGLKVGGDWLPLWLSNKLGMTPPDFLFFCISVLPMLLS